MAISINSPRMGGRAQAERLQAALADVSFLQGELDRTYQALAQIEGCSEQGLDEVRFQLAELVALGAERRAVQQDAAGLVAQIDALQDQHVEMQRQMAAMRRQWFAGNAADGAADSQEELFELRLRMAAVTQHWISREITSAPASQPSPTREAVACPA